MPSDRQLSLLIWLVVAAPFVLSNHDLRRGLVSLIRMTLVGKVAVPFSMMLMWVTGEVLIARWLAWWYPSMTTSTAFWFVGSGLVLFLNLPQAAEEDHFFRRKLMAAVGFTVLFGVYMNLFVLSLPAELALQPILFILVATSALASHDDEHKQVKKVIDTVIAVLLSGLVAYEAVSIASHWSSIDLVRMAWQFYLPVWLTLGLLPLIYLTGMYSQYESAFVGTEWTTGKRWGRRWALVTSFGPQSHKLHSFMKSSAHVLMKTSTFTEARQAIRQTGQGVDSEEDIRQGHEI